LAVGYGVENFIAIQHIPNTSRMVNVRMTQNDRMKCLVQICTSTEEIIQIGHQLRITIEIAVVLTAGVHHYGSAWKLYHRRGPLAHVNEMHLHGLRGGYGPKRERQGQRRGCDLSRP